MATRTRRRIRYAVVGLGHLAQASVLPAFARAKGNSELVALVSGDAEKLETLGRRYDVAHRFSYDTFARCLPLVDAVYICTPNTEHMRYAVEAALGGVHVLCEKPLAVSEPDCRRMLAARDAGGVKFMTAYRLHFEPSTLAVADLARRGQLGDLRYMTSSFSMQATPGGIRTRPETGGGALWDIGIYCINAARLFFGAEPVRVSAHAVRGQRSDMPGVDETTSAWLHFDGDRLAAFTCSFDAADVSSCRLVGAAGDVVLEPAFSTDEAIAYTVTTNGVRRRRPGRRVDQFAAELVYFSRCIVDDVAPEPSGEEGAWDVQVIEALYRSIREGTAVTLPPFAGARPTSAQRLTLPPPTRKARLVNVQPPHD